MRLDKYMIGLILFSLVVLITTGIIGDMNTNYGLDMDTDQFNETYDTIDSMYNITRDMKAGSFDAELESGQETTDSTIKGAFSTLRLVKNTPALVNNILTDIGRVLHVPSFIIEGFMVILMLSIIFSFIYLVLRFIPGD